MLFRKIERKIRRHLVENPGKVAIVSGARQIGKSFIIRHVGKDMFRNFVELNLVADRNMREAFARVH
ncbi:MAG: ATPase, partial [Paramuribaculum sp.]|nr:ATPase [Paramuribaculum sp.]